MPGKFELYKDKAGQYRFRLKAGNGEIVLSSEGYASKSSAKNGVKSVQKNAGSKEQFETKKTRTGKHRFALKAKNHQVIGTGQNYDSASACANGIGAVGRAAKGAKMVDTTK